MSNNESAARPKKSGILNFRVSNDLKDESKAVLEQYNLDHSKAIRLFLEYVAESKSLPAELAEYMSQDKKK